ncbi:metal ABC transporter solute-binding protein, Zn/Mn family [Alkalihalobacillus deserti]|uniref:metal ABC transporter solute-binding protein, Zn/Mn family n=1 Tax=Alkalihalobacillus deserti TaxID=2879466 RepID=UPI001D15C76A|nr:zinc ABC transporter substrate-binding protein [Alkalihalobacillus deserti]
MKLKYITFGFILVLFTFLASCNTQQTETSTSKENENEATQQEEVKPLKIYTTLYPLEDFTKKIGGENVDIESIIPPGSDAHTYEPTSKQMINIAEADAFIYNGLGMESFSEKIAAALESEKVIMVEAAHGIETIAHEHDHHHEDELNEGREHEHKEDEEHGLDNEEFDPHVWLDPYRSIILAENIKNALVELRPDAKEEFDKNYELLKSELEKLDEEFHQLVASKIEPEILVSHAAYGYWEERYGIHQIAVAGLSQSDEPSQKALENIIEIANEKQIKYVIFEQNVTPKVAEVIRKEINAEPLRLHNISVLTAENIQQQEDYFSLMQKNLETLDKALD